MKKILITGADGFVGGFLVSGLSAKGHKVTGTVFIRQPESKTEYWLDITRPETFSSLPAETFDVVIHNAAMVDQKAPRKRMYAVNADGTRNVIHWARSHGCRHLVHISSSSVYGLKTMGQNRCEGTQGLLSQLGTAYQRSKAKAEKLVRTSGLDYTILRLPAIIGKGDSFVSPALIKYLNGGGFFRAGHRDWLVSVLDVRDLANVLDRVIDHPATNTAYNCPGHHVKWMALVGEYARMLGVKVPGTRRSFLSILAHLGAKEYVFLAVNSKFGSHMPNEKFVAEFGYQGSGSWKSAVEKAVRNGFLWNGRRE
jgi:nucleoside-diphosphate-sugar epimerase